MRFIFTTVLLSLAATPAFAQVADAIALPEPDAISLIAIGALALLVSRRRKP